MLEKKNLKNSQRLREEEQIEEQKSVMVNIMDLIYDLSKTFIFHNDWELRHGALIYLRAYSRVFKRNFYTSQIPDAPMHVLDLKNICEYFFLNKVQQNNKITTGKIFCFIKALLR